MADNVLWFAHVISFMVPTLIITGMVIGMNAFFKWVRKLYVKNFGV